MEKLASGNIIFLERLTKTTDIFLVGRKSKKRIGKAQEQKRHY